jgi:putative MFS transporter
VIDGLGFGRAQIKVLLLGGGVWASDGCELAMVCTLIGVTKKEFGLGSYEAGTLATFAFVGLFIGCLVGGCMGDYFGRRIPIMMSYAGVAVFGGCTALAGNYLSLVLMRLLCGVSMGLGMASSQVLLSEITPYKWRMVMSALRHSIFVTGYMYACLLFWWFDYTLEKLPWRHCFVLGVIPPVISLLLSIPFLTESPVWLGSVGEHERAHKEFDAMRRLNGRPAAPIEYDRFQGMLGSQGSTGIKLQMQLILGSGALGATMVLVCACVVINLQVYGHTYGAPKILIKAHQEEDHGIAPAATLFYESLVGFVGALATVVGTVLTRKQGINVGLFLVSLFMAGIGGFALMQPRWWLVVAVFQVSFFGRKILVDFVFQFVYQAASEIYPTRVLATGCGVTISCGRLGAILAPIIFEACRQATNRLESFYYVSAGAGALALLFSILVFPKDVVEKRQELEEIASACTTLKTRHSMLA